MLSNIQTHIRKWRLMHELCKCPHWCQNSTRLHSSVISLDYVIMDNLRTHHCNFVGELIRAKGAIPLYLPPYSPDLNPIEKMWAKMKSILRKWRIRIKDKLIPAILQALNLVTPSDCQGWFTCAGY